MRSHVITIPPAVIAVMQEHAFAGYPGECCGLVFAPAASDAATRALPMENLIDRLHAQDPEGYPRTSRDGFEMNALKKRRAADEAQARGERLLAIFHSHIDCDAYFSREDQDMAAPPPEHLPTEPGLWHVVMACYKDGMRAARAYRWDGRGFAGHDLPGFALAIRLPRA